MNEEVKDLDDEIGGNKRMEDLEPDDPMSFIDDISISQARRLNKAVGMALVNKGPSEYKPYIDENLTQSIGSIVSHLYGGNAFSPDEIAYISMCIAHNELKKMLSDRSLDFVDGKVVNVLEDDDTSSENGKSA